MDGGDLGTKYLDYLQKSCMCTCRQLCQRTPHCKVHKTPLDVPLNPTPRAASTTSTASHHQLTSPQPPPPAVASQKTTSGIAVLPHTECLIQYEPHDAQPQRYSNGGVTGGGGVVSKAGTVCTSSTSSGLNSGDDSDSDSDDVDVTGDPEAFQEAYLASTKAELCKTFEDSGLDLSDRESTPNSKLRRFVGQTSGKAQLYINGGISGVCVINSNTARTKHSRAQPVNLGERSFGAIGTDNYDTVSMTSMEVANIMSIPPEAPGMPTVIPERKKAVAGKVLSSAETNNNEPKSGKKHGGSKKRGKAELNNFIQQSLQSFIHGSPDEASSSPTHTSGLTNTNRHRKDNKPQMILSLNRHPSHTHPHHHHHHHAPPQQTHTSRSGATATNNSTASAYLPDVCCSIRQRGSADGSCSDSTSVSGSGSNATHKATSSSSSAAGGGSTVRPKCGSSCSGSSNDTYSSTDTDSISSSSASSYKVSLSTLLLSGYQILHVKVNRRDETFSVIQYVTHVVKDSSSSASSSATSSRSCSTSPRSSANHKTLYSHVIVISESRTSHAHAPKLRPMDVLVEVNGEFVLHAEKSTVESLIQQAHKVSLVIARKVPLEDVEDNVV